MFEANIAAIRTKIILKVLLTNCSHEMIGDQVRMILVIKIWEREIVNVCKRVPIIQLEG